MTLDELRAQGTVAVGEAHTWPKPVGDYAPTLEDCEFLYALVRTMKPRLVVESGTGCGYSGRFIAEALADNAGGKLVTYESYKQYADPARPLLAGLPAEVVHGDCPVRLDADLVHLDSGPGIRPQQIAEWLASGYTGLIVVHDANRRYPELTAGRGVFIPGSDGFWVGTCA